MNQRKHIILFLNENPLPAIYTRGTISAKELRLRSALPEIDEIHVIARRGAYVSSHHQEQTALEDKIVVHLLPPWPYYLAPLPLFFVGLYFTLRLHPLTIEAESPHLSGVAAVLLGLLTRRPAIIEIRATYDELVRFRFRYLPLPFKRAMLHLVQTFTLRHARAVIANSRTYAQSLFKGGISSTVINPGLQYAPKVLPKAVNHQPLTLGYLGRLVPEKGVDYLIKAVADLSRQGLVPPFRVEIAGEGTDRPRLETMVHQNALEHMVTFLGQVDNYTVLQEWDILVNPCLVNHPLEMVNAEAALCGVAVISFGNPTIPETVVDQQTGLKIPHKTVADLTEGIRFLLTHPADLAKIKKAAPAFAVKNYSFATQVTRLATLYRQLGILP